MKVKISRYMNEHLLVVFGGPNNFALVRLTYPHRVARAHPTYVDDCEEAHLATKGYVLQEISEIEPWRKEKQSRTILQMAFTVTYSTEAGIAVVVDRHTVEVGVVVLDTAGFHMLD